MVIFLKFTYYYNILRGRHKIKQIKKWINFCDITLLSENCIGGVLYHDINQQFISPTINLFFTPSDFIKFVNDLGYYLSLTPQIKMGKHYPIGVLDDIKIFFMHYTSCEEAFNKWEERKKRINYDKIFVIMVERDGFSKEDFENFKMIKYPKLLFTKTKEYECDCSYYMSKYKKLEQLPDIIQGRHIYDKMRLINEINRAYGNNG